MSTKTKLEQLEKEFAEVINRNGLDSMVGMPDYIIASFIVTSISALKSANVANEAHKDNPNHAI